MNRVGIGYDVHQLKKGRPLVLGGVDIPYESGLDGHSDADVLMHAICDAVAATRAAHPAHVAALAGWSAAVLEGGVDRARIRQAACSAVVVEREWVVGFR